MINRRLSKILSETILILEQEEGGDLFGGDEGGDEEEEAADAEEGGGDEPTDEEAEEEEGTEEEEEEGAEEEESAYPLGKAVDDEISALFVDYEEDAIRSAATRRDEKEEVKEGLSMMKILYEQDNPEGIDLEVFAQNVARLIKNYDNLLDMENLILTKAVEFITTYYDEESATTLEDLLDVRFGLSLSDDEDIVAPMATGASATAAEGGA